MGTVENITLTVCMASRVAVVGANGAGKSTAIKLLIGELKPDSGTIWRHQNIPTHIDLKKQAAFLRYVLLSESNTVKSLVDDIYSYAYRYEKMGVYKDNKYTGETICSFVYLNKNFRFKQQDN